MARPDTMFVNPSGRLVLFQDVQPLEDMLVHLHVRSPLSQLLGQTTFGPSDLQGAPPFSTSVLSETAGFASKGSQNTISLFFGALP